MTRFEYKTIDVPMTRKNTFSMTQIDEVKLNESLNSLGEQGWELVSTVENTSGGTILKTIMIFKRAIATS